MNGFNHDVFCTACLDTGTVRGEYADDEGCELEFCTRCQAGEELADRCTEPLDVNEYPELARAS